MPKPDLNNCGVIEEFKVEAKDQSDGDQILDTRITNRKTGDRVLRFWQIQIELPDSALPATGAMTVEIRSPGSAGYQEVVGSIDLTQEAALLFTFEALADYVKLVPASLEAGLLYNAYLSVSE